MTITNKTFDLQLVKSIKKHSRSCHVESSIYPLKSSFTLFNRKHIWNEMKGLSPTNIHHFIFHSLSIILRFHNDEILQLYGSLQPTEPYPLWIFYNSCLIDRDYIWHCFAKMLCWRMWLKLELIIHGKWKSVFNFREEMLTDWKKDEMEFTMRIYIYDFCLMI